MPTQPPQLFVVRVWLEPHHSPDLIWRGSIEHLPSRQRQYFADLLSLVSFIQSKLREAANTESALKNRHNDGGDVHAQHPET